MDGEYRNQYDEIDIISYIKIFSKRKNLIIGLGLIFAIIAGIYSYFIAEKVYKIDTVLESAIISGPEDGSSKAIEEAFLLKNKIQEGVYGIYVREKLAMPEGEYIKPKAVNPEKTNLITIKIESGQVEKAKQILEEINSFILKESQEKVKLKKQSVEDNIKGFENEIKLSQRNIELTKEQIIRNDNSIIQEIKRLNNKILLAEEEKENLKAEIAALEQVLIYEQTPGTQFALFNVKSSFSGKKQEIENLYSQVNSLTKQREDSKDNLETNIKNFESAIEELNTKINYLKASLEEIRPVRIVKEPVISGSPIKPKPTFNMTVAGALGLFIGIISALFKEWWDKSKLS